MPVYPGCPVELVKGFGPPTCRLQGGCSPTELHQHGCRSFPAARNRCLRPHTGLPRCAVPGSGLCGSSASQKGVHGISPTSEDISRCAWPDPPHSPPGTSFPYERPWPPLAVWRPGQALNLLPCGMTIPVSPLRFPLRHQGMLPVFPGCQGRLLRGLHRRARCRLHLRFRTWSGTAARRFSDQGGISGLLHPEVPYHDQAISRAQGSSWMSSPRVRTPALARLFFM